METTWDLTGDTSFNFARSNGYSNLIMDFTALTRPHMWSRLNSNLSCIQIMLKVHFAGKRDDIDTDSTVNFIFLSVSKR